MNHMLNQIKKKVVPAKSLQARKDKLVSKVIDLVSRETAKYSQVIGIELGGSFAKGTWLPERADIDIFIKFRTDVSEKEFAEVGKKIGFAALADYMPYVRYAEHPFVEAQIEDTKVNLVPCYAVEEGSWKSSADRSPFHTRFMKQSLTDEMKDQVRILKWFLKCNDIYGAEIAKQGFSGYVAEVLILNFGTFEGVLKAMSCLKCGEVIGKAAKEFDSPIVIIDPIDANRNLGAAISTENLGKLVLLSRAFLRKPSHLFFKPRKPNTFVKSSLRNVLVISFRYKKRSPDVIWGQLKRATASIATQIDQEGFTVLRKSAFVLRDNEAFLLFLLQSPTLHDSKLRVGPDFFVSEYADKFVMSNKKKSVMMWINDDGKICSLQKRPYTSVQSFVRDLLRKNLQNAGISVGLQEDIKKFKITVGDRVKSKSIKEAIAELVSTDEAIFSSN